jgi:flagellar basal body P-ring formation chaperone FlgA
MLPTLGLIAASAIIPIKPAAEVELRGREIRLGDVADLNGLGPAARARLAPRVIARVPAGRRGISISRAGLAGLVRRSVPGLRPVTVEPAAAVTFRVLQGADETRRAGVRCVALSRPIARGEALAASDLVSASCDDGTSGHLIRFDRRGLVARAAADLPAGTHLGRLLPSRPLGIEAGDKVTLVSRAGPVRVERAVVALQPGRAGGSVFVIDRDGQVSSAPVALAQAGEERE